MVLGWIGKSAIFLLFIMGFKRDIYQKKGIFFSLLCSIKTEANRVIFQKI